MTETQTKSKRVPMGQLLMTARINEYISRSPELYRFVHGCIGRHRYGDYGDTSHHDEECNDDALERGGRIISNYNLPVNVIIPGESRIWIITEADRSFTTVLFPSDY